jgi:hypothetical protein
MKVEYVLAPPDVYWHCKSHNRRATHLLVREGQNDVHHCDPRLGGIMLPCQCELLNFIDVTAAQRHHDCIAG